MDRVFLITNGNIGGTAGDSTLILRRAKAMYEEKNLFTQVLLINPLNQENVNTGDYYYSIEVCDSKATVKKKIAEQTPKYVILYGDKIQMMTVDLHKYVRSHQMNTKIIIDVQGAVEEKKEYSDSLFCKFVVYPLSCFYFKRAIKNADGVFVVSDEMKYKCEQNRGSAKGSFEYFKVRCGVERLMSLEEIKDNRKTFRAIKQLNDETIVFCYSGYRAKWQKIDEIIEHFKRFDEENPNCYFAFFCNTDSQFEVLLKDRFPKGNYCVEHLKPDTYFKSLCGCDIGYILRDYNETNRVAFPNKFSDYLISGLIVALNNALPEPMRLINNKPSHYVNTDTVNREEFFIKVRQRANEYDDFVSRSISLCKKELLYSSQVKNLTL